MPKKPKVKRDSLSIHRNQAWDAFSMYIRTRDSILTTGTVDNCICVTCPAWRPRTGSGCIQAGHFPEISGRLNAVLFEERGVHGQCYECNHEKSGNPIEYMKFMLKTYGKTVVAELIALKNTTVIYSRSDYNRIRRSYDTDTKLLLKDHGLAKWSVPELDTELPF